jgi:hypothetical protein
MQNSLPFNSGMREAHEGPSEFYCTGRTGLQRTASHSKVVLTYVRGGMRPSDAVTYNSHFVGSTCSYLSFRNIHNICGCNVIMFLISCLKMVHSFCPGLNISTSS